MKRLKAELKPSIWIFSIINCIVLCPKYCPCPSEILLSDCKVKVQEVLISVVPTSEVSPSYQIMS